MVDNDFSIDDEEYFSYLMKEKRELLVELIPNKAFRFSLMSHRFLIDLKDFADTLRVGSDDERKAVFPLLDNIFEALKKQDDGIRDEERNLF